ncbi:MAG: methionyl-tRNA formyltransferase [Mycobacteriales bacterium]
MRLVFAGTPGAAVPSLHRLLGSAHEVAAVVTRPDARAGRGRTLHRSPVGAVADEHGIEVLTPRRPGEPGFVARLTELAPDACPIVAYGALIRPAALAIPRHGWVNLHFSLLPAWRGAAPVQHAVMAGEEMTGASTFQLDEGMDSGGVYGVVTEVVRPRDTSGDLLGRLADSGADLLLATLDGIESGTVRPQPQPPDGISLAPKVTVEDARVDWGLPALAVDRRIRGCTPAPGAWTTYDGGRLKLGPPVAVHPPESAAAQGLSPGELRLGKSSVLAGTPSGAVELGTVQSPGKRSMPADAWARGLRLPAGARLA